MREIRNRTAEVVPLGVVAAEVAQGGDLVGLLDTLRRHDEAVRMTEIDQRLDLSAGVATAAARIE